MVERLAEAGITPSGAPSVVYQSPLGAVLRARHGATATYLKAASRAFPHEAAITRELARGTPDRVPQVVAIEASENLLLMHDLAGPPLADAPESTWADALRHVADLQRRWVGRTADLVGAGAQVRPIDRLAEALPALLEDDGLGARLDPELRASWDAALPRLIDACHALAAMGVPDTLVHGDLHPGNIAVTSGGPVIFDWSDGAVSHPFLDLAVFFRRVKDVSVRPTMRDAYLDGWEGIVARDDLERAVELAMTVGAAYQVATYQALLPSLDPLDRAVYEGADVSWVRRTLDGLARGLEAPAI
jgi:tRNA A-37 threonylcarbamoyl transferase component Bud32